MFLEKSPFTRGCDCFNPEICEAPPPKTSYLYATNGDYLFPKLEELREYSFNPPLNLRVRERKFEVHFTFNQGPAIYCSGAFLRSLEEFLKQLNLSQDDISQDEKYQIECHFQGRKIKQI